MVARSSWSGPRPPADRSTRTCHRPAAPVRPPDPCRCKTCNWQTREIRLQQQSHTNNKQKGTAARAVTRQHLTHSHSVTAVATAPVHVRLFDRCVWCCCVTCDESALAVVCDTQRDVGNGWAVVLRDERRVCFAHHLHCLAVDESAGDAIGDTRHRAIRRHRAESRLSPTDVAKLAVVELERSGTGRALVETVAVHHGRWTGHNVDVDAIRVA